MPAANCNGSSLTRVWPWMAIGGAVIAAAFGGAGVWSATVPLASAVVAGGVVTVDTNRKRVQHLEGGIVAELRVRDGGRVAAGDVVIRLDDTRAKASLAIVAAAYREELAKEARYVAERDEAETIAWPEMLENDPGDPEPAAIRDSQTAIFRSRRETLHGEIAILRERVSQLIQEIEGLMSQKQATERQIALIREELEPLQALFENGHTTKQRILALRREAAKLDGQHGLLVADIARARKTIGETKLAIIQQEKAFRSEVVSTLRDVQAKVSDLRERFIAAQDVLNRIDIRSPVAGKVVNLAVHGRGAVIQPGETVLEIVPSDDELTIEVHIQPHDIGNVAPGLGAEVRLLAFKQRTTPTLTGVVESVSADALTNPQSGLTYYLARIRIADTELVRLKGRHLQPGMPAEVMIRTGERTALVYMVQPILDSMDRAWREE